MVHSVQQTPGPLMEGKRGLVLGVANARSIAWGIVRTLKAHGAKLGLTYQGELFKRRVVPLAESVDAAFAVDCDVTDDASLAGVFATAARHWDKIDFVVHAVAYSDKEQLKGRYADTTRDNFLRTMDISCYSFTAVARRAGDMMTDGGRDRKSVV